ncbi:gamma-glutamylcyclotransferase family protein [Pseudofrancisella aestuarii]|uniref:Gamma-glutamylcyclotransferase family protein n=1 Tax=Pseudofrancisella aestuarii TaxID=2670347 RepID=A0ABV9TEB6_9GAMM|nr:gamma-glutamylcyclotransferase family protein [Pseudofrancisella aestuarii]
MKKLLLGSLIGVLGISFAIADECHPKIDESQANFIVGYGSLINDKSRQRTNPEAKNVYPVEVKNFKRVWGLRASESFRGTFLLAVPSEGDSFNAVYYPVDTDGVLAADEREHDYCRYKLEPKDVKSLGLKNLPKGQYWIYATNAKEIHEATKEYPIIQSYVDLFMNGCLEIQDRYLIKDYAEQCIKTTGLWNENWINDRVNPRRPTDSTPGAVQIDKLLAPHFSNYYNHSYE